VEASKEQVLEIITELEKAGAETVVLPNTELPLLVAASDTQVKLLDTIAIHTRLAVSLALAIG
jgi:aspartate racemase